MTIERGLSTELRLLLDHVSPSTNVIVSKDQWGERYLVRPDRAIRVEPGQAIEAGLLLVEGSVDLHGFLRLFGLRPTLERLVGLVTASCSPACDSRAIQVLLKPLFEFVRVVDRNESPFSDGEIVWSSDFQDENTRTIASGRRPAYGEGIFVGLSEALERSPLLR